MATSHAARPLVVPLLAAVIGAGAVALAFAGAGGQAGAAPAQDAWIAKEPKGNFLTLKDPDGSFTMQYPRRDWSVVPGGGPVIATIVHKRFDAAIVIELAWMKQPLAPDEITDLFAEIERDLLTRERHPKATDFQTRILTDGDRKLVVLQYVRPGMAGMERVRQYSIPVGRRLFRISCVAAIGSFAANERWFAHAVATFVPTATE